MKKKIIAVACILIVLFTITSCGGAHKIIIDEYSKASVEKCPSRADAGETVEVCVKDVKNAGVFVAVDGDQFYGEFTKEEGNVYRFTMPDKDVTVSVWYVSRSLPAHERIADLK